MPVGPAASHGGAPAPAQAVSSTSTNGGMFAGLDLFSSAAATASAPASATATAPANSVAANTPASLFGGLSLAGMLARLPTDETELVATTMRVTCPCTLADGYMPGHRCSYCGGSPAASQAAWQRPGRPALQFRPASAAGERPCPRCIWRPRQRIRSTRMVPAGPHGSEHATAAACKWVGGPCANVLSVCSATDLTGVLAEGHGPSNVGRIQRHRCSYRQRQRAWRRLRF